MGGVRICPDVVGASAPRRLSAVTLSHLFVPTPVMPVSPKINVVIGHDNQVKRSLGNSQLAAWAQVFLGCLIRLDGTDRYAANIAHAMTAKVATIATTTIAMSKADLSWSRNGLKPTASR